MIMKKSLCLFGDSVGKGVIFDNEKQRYVQSSEAFYHIFENKSDCDITNKCKFGCTVSKGEAIVHKCGDTLGNYDYVILQYGGNDSDFDWAQVAASPFEPHECCTPVNQFKEKTAGLIKYIRSCGSKPVLMSVAPVDSEKYFSWITRNGGENAVLNFLGSKTRIEHWNELYNNAVWSVGNACGVPVIDIRSPILYERDFEKYFCIDGIHPNVSGHRRIAEGIMPYIKDIIV